MRLNGDSLQRAGLAAVVAGLLWVAAWAHLLLAHGTTEVNERRLVLGLSWFDSGRLIAPALVLAGVALWLIGRRIGRGGARIALAVAMIGLSVAALGAALGFWMQPFGTYQGASREVGIAAVGGGLATLGSLILAPGVAAVAAFAARAGIIGPWMGGLLAAGALLAAPWLHESRQGVLFGIAWLATGLALLSGRAQLPGRAPVTPR